MDVSDLFEQFRQNRDDRNRRNRDRDRGGDGGDFRRRRQGSGDEFRANMKAGLILAGLSMRVSRASSFDLASTCEPLNRDCR